MKNMNSVDFKTVSLLAMVAFIFVGCQSKPTKLIEESANPFAPNAVIVDTRSSFYFASFHIEGSVNLNSSDYLILKNPKSKFYVLDPDLSQVIERLAKRGIAPHKKVILLSETANNIENKKWRWLLKNLEVEDVMLLSLDDFKKIYKSRRFADPTPDVPWTLKSSPELQKELILNKAKDCFVKWSATCD